MEAQGDRRRALRELEKKHWKDEMQRAGMAKEALQKYTPEKRAVKAWTYVQLLI